MTSVPSFTILRWPDATDEYECVMKEVMFNDGKERIICTNEFVPHDHWPKDVYQKNESGGYDIIGKYVMTKTQSTQQLNRSTMKWEGTPSVEIYEFKQKREALKKQDQIVVVVEN